ncbi:hypothetical protein JY651_02030 [Pyxidicoccus parkwayensis]|uniref:DUF4261 domain-containing protein n=1 Tax=Pyxidicoccus parkwayensis TaxID=2813578 RepID=A0ABX7NXZ9_9BACT|nr:hypothetical protein [Pyxidicoccus parkwaysis]QSQ23786.1 hypothetical protein JY651_02030 [Pyxidicoccus parkwaysis]
MSASNRPLKWNVGDDSRPGRSLQLLLEGPLQLQPERVQALLRKWHPSLREATFTAMPWEKEAGAHLGLISWGEHTVQLAGFDVPMPSAALEPCLQPSHYDEALKDRARGHSTHLLLWYAGQEPSPFEQYVALANITGALASLGAFLVVNSDAFNVAPIEPLCATDADPFDYLRAMPLQLLFCGLVKMEVEGTPGVWMRTFGAHLLGLPDFARLTRGHDEGQFTFMMFERVWKYLRGSQARFKAGDTLQAGRGMAMRLRHAREQEYFLRNPGELFVMEPMSVVSA